jgi:hypothetical protein
MSKRKYYFMAIPLYWIYTIFWLVSIYYILIYWDINIIYKIIIEILFALVCPDGKGLFQSYMLYKKEMNGIFMKEK